MIIAFAGHASVPSCEKVKQIIKESIRTLVRPDEVLTFYLGGYGDFDRIALSACREMKNEYCAEVVYVTPYMNFKEQEKIRDMLKHKLCDASLYPPIEHVPPRFAILKRNEWMMKNADVIIAYVSHNFGGAYKSIQIARRNNKRIINTFELLDF